MCLTMLPGVLLAWQSPALRMAEAALDGLLSLPSKPEQQCASFPGAARAVAGVGAVSAQGHVSGW